MAHSRCQINIHFHENCDIFPWRAYIHKETKYAHTNQSTNQNVIQYIIKCHALIEKEKEGKKNRLVLPVVCRIKDI